jgi:hypothetical protein
MLDRGWVDPRASLDVAEKIKILLLPHHTKFTNQPVREEHYTIFTQPGCLKVWGKTFVPLVAMGWRGAIMCVT